MDYKFFLQGITNIVLNPVKAWETIDTEDRPEKLLRDSYFFPLILLVTISTFIGSLLFTNAELRAVYSVLFAVKSFVVLYISVYTSAYLLGEITFPLDLGKDFKISFRLIVYSITPFLICQVLSGMFESVLFVNIIGLYGLYIFWTGSEKLLTPPHYKKMPMLIATTVCLTGIFIATNVILNMLLNRIYFAYFA